METEDPHDVAFLSTALRYMRLGDLETRLSKEQRETAAEFWRTVTGEQVLEIYIRVHDKQDPQEFMDAIRYCQEHKEEVQALHSYTRKPQVVEREGDPSQT